MRAGELAFIPLGEADRSVRRKTWPGGPLFVRSPLIGFRSSRVTWVVLAVAALCTANFSTSASARKRRAEPSEPNFDAVKPQLRNADTNPTLRFPIAYIYRQFGPGLSYGWLDITRENVRYAAEEPPQMAGEGFEFTQAQIKEK